MSQHHTRALLELGRKAGLHTGELYRALTSRPPSPGEAPTGQADTNGYVEQFDSQGHRRYVRDAATFEAR